MPSIYDADGGVTVDRCSVSAGPMFSFSQRFSSFFRPSTFIHHKRAQSANENFRSQQNHHQKQKDGGQRHRSHSHITLTKHIHAPQLKEEEQRDQSRQMRPNCLEQRDLSALQAIIVPDDREAQERRKISVSTQQDLPERSQSRLRASSSQATQSEAPRRSQSRDVASSLQSRQSESPRRSDNSERYSSVQVRRSETPRRIEELEHKVRALKECKRIVRRLTSGDLKEMGEAASEVRLSAKDNAQTRVTFSILGAIPPLVKLLDSSYPAVQCSALFALLNLAIGNDHNKATIVEDGAIPRMAKLIRGANDSVQEAAVAAFLSLSALDQNKPIIGRSGVVSTLVNMLEHGSTQAKQDSLRTLYNLSICKENVEIMVEAGIAEPLLEMVDEPEHVERVLWMLGNLAGVEVGRKAMADSQFTVPILTEILRWSDAPKCQEQAVYVLMVLGHHSWQQRREMERIGVVSALLEVALLGTALAQKRASRLLENLRDDRLREKPVSAPMASTTAELWEISEDDCGEEISEERRAVNNLVQQSLERNLQKIIKRANVAEFKKSHRLTSLTTTSSSKSLPY